MTDLIIEKLNESYITISGDRGALQELKENYSFYADGYRYHKKYKCGIWDGKIYLLNFITKTKAKIFTGLLPDIIKFFESREYTYTISDDIIKKNEFVDYEDFVNKVKISSKGQLITPRDYQINGFKSVIQNKRNLLHSVTGSGKSLIIYLISLYLASKNKKGIIIVPNISLVHQLYSDFEDYSTINKWNVENSSHKIYSGKEKYTDKSLTFSTWQSISALIRNNEKEADKILSEYDFVIIDEAHQAKSSELNKIITKCNNAEYRIGLTGTLTKCKADINQIVGLTGKINRLNTTRELIDKKELADFAVNCLILKYNKDEAKAIKKFKYQDEIKYLVTNTKRNNFIKNLALSLPQNTIILFNFIQHGKLLYELINNSKYKGDRNVYLIYGDVEGDERERIRKIVETESNAIIIGSSAVMSTGINIKSLHNIIFAINGKSVIRILQSIGRAIRLHEDKEKAQIYDIIDDLTVGKHQNFAVKHFLERIKIYTEQSFEYKIKSLDFS